jgi:hypothetical protein
MMTATNTESKKIAELNDRFRKGELGLGVKKLTQGVSALSKAQKLRLLALVKNFNESTSENNPYGERDFGSVELDEEMYFWKIDYYDLSLTVGSEDPANTAVTRRVLTIMHSSEY